MALGALGCSHDSDDGPGVPLILRVDGGTKQLSVSWTDEKAAAYEVYYSGTDTEPAKKDPALLTDISGTSANITGLADGTPYWVWVRAKGGSWSGAETATTLSGGNILSEFKIGSAAGVIDEAAGTITVKVPYAEAGSQPVSWTVSPGAAVSVKTAENASGVSVYTVQAANGESKDYTVKRIVEGQGGITLKFTDEGAGALEEANVSLSKTTEPTTLTLEAATGYESYEWFVDGESKGTTRSITLNAVGYSLGKHYVSVEVWKNNVLYSKETAFTVVD
jgi:hypothetical protein